MQKFLEYLAYMLNFADLNSSESFQDRVLSEIIKAMDELSYEELECLENVFEGYDLFFQREANSLERLIRFYNCFDEKEIIIRGFAVEISRLEKQKRTTEARALLFSKVCDLAKMRKSKLGR